MLGRPSRGWGMAHFLVFFWTGFSGCRTITRPGYGGGLWGTLALEARRGGSSGREGGGGDGTGRDEVGEK